MIRIEVPDRATADRLVTAAYIAAGLIPAPAVPDSEAVAFAGELARQMDALPPAPEAARE